MLEYNLIYLYLLSYPLQKKFAYSWFRVYRHNFLGLTFLLASYGAVFWHFCFGFFLSLLSILYLWPSPGWLAFGNKLRILAFCTFLSPGYSRLDIYSLGTANSMWFKLNELPTSKLVLFLFVGSLSSVTWQKFLLCTTVNWVNKFSCNSSISIPYSLFSAFVSYFLLYSCSFLAVYSNILLRS